MTKTKSNLSQDQWVKCIVQGGNLKATAISAQGLVANARLRHNLNPGETIALGEALIAGLLLASTCKNGERVSLSVKGDRIFKQTVVDAIPSGSVRGFISSRTQPGSAIDSSKGPWQNGLLSVVRLRLTEKDPYVGTIPNVTGHLAKDVTFYLTQSEQIPSAVGLAVNVADDGTVLSAGGFLVQALPGANAQEVQMVQDNISHFQNLAEQISTDSNPKLLLGHIFNDIPFTLLEEKPLSFECNCSKDRVTRAIKLLGKIEVAAMLTEDKQASIHCDFCALEYKFSEQELQNILTEIS